MTLLILGRQFTPDIVANFTLYINQYISEDIDGDNTSNDAGDISLANIAYQTRSQI